LASHIEYIDLIIEQHHYCEFRQGCKHNRKQEQNKKGQIDGDLIWGVIRTSPGVSAQIHAPFLQIDKISAKDRIT
jgi:hypothetical protein